MVKQLHNEKTLELLTSNDMCSLKGICVAQVISYWNWILRPWMSWQSYFKKQEFGSNRLKSSMNSLNDHSPLEWKMTFENGLLIC